MKYLGCEIVMNLFFKSLRITLAGHPNPNQKWPQETSQGPGSVFHKTICWKLLSIMVNDVQWFVPQWEFGYLYCILYICYSFRSIWSKAFPFKLKHKTDTQTRGWVQRGNTLYQNIKSGPSFFLFSVLITSLPTQSITCKVIVWLKFSVQPPSSSCLAPSPHPLSVSAPCTHISSRGRTGKVYRSSTLRYNHDHWSNSLLSVYTHIQFVRTLRGVSGEVFVWLDLSGTGPCGFT